MRRYFPDACHWYSHAHYFPGRQRFSVFHRTDAINGGANAGLLAAKILATSDAELLGKLKAYSTKLKEQVEAKDAKLQEIGYKAYLEGMKK